MRPPANAKLHGAVFALLAVSSLGLKAAVGPPTDGLVGSRHGAFEQMVIGKLQSQAFVINVRQFRYRSPLILAERGRCRLAVRDAMEGAAMEPTFAQDAEAIAPVIYLYRGSSYSTAPEVALRLGRLEAEGLHRLGIRRPTLVLIALAASPGCGSDRFGLEALELPA